MVLCLVVGFGRTTKAARGWTAGFGRAVESLALHANALRRQLGVRRGVLVLTLILCDACTMGPEVPKSSLSEKGGTEMVQFYLHIHDPTLERVLDKRARWGDDDSGLYGPAGEFKPNDLMRRAG